MTLNLRDDLAAIRTYLVKRVALQAANREAVSCIEFGYQVSQGGLLLLDFDTRHPRPLDNRWTSRMGQGLELPHWVSAAEALEMKGGTLIMPAGETRTVDAGSFEELAQLFGEAVLEVAFDALADGTFRPLNLRDDCELMVADFDGNWDNGAEQFINRLPVKLLPS
jgi:hypothetical protein